MNNPSSSPSKTFSPSPSQIESKEGSKNNRMLSKILIIGSIIYIYFFYIDYNKMKIVSNLFTGNSNNLYDLFNTNEYSFWLICILSFIIWYL